ncbi:MAG: RDD family protein [Planctomycetota bacterium]|nr:RDD family protein [Planctomycetota bacterium]
MTKQSLRRQALGFSFGILILLFIGFESAFWWDYAYSPQLVSLEKLYLLYQRNPMLGAEKRTFCRVKAESGWGAEKKIEQSFAPAVSLDEGRVAFLYNNGIAVYREEIFETEKREEKKEESWLFSLQMPENLLVADGYFESGKLLVAAWKKEDERWNLLRLEFELKKGAKPKEEVWINTKEPFPLEMSKFKGEFLLVAMAEDKTIFLVNSRGEREKTPLKTATSFCAESDGETLHLFTVSPLKGTPCILNHYTTKDLKEFRLMSATESPFTTPLLGKRRILNINTTLWKGSPVVVCFLGSIIGVWMDGKYEEVLSVPAATRLVLSLWLALIMMVAVLLVGVAIRLFSARESHKTESIPQNLATISTRALSFSVDFTILLLLLLPFLPASTIFQQSFATTHSIGNPFLISLLRILYFTLFEGLFATTPGKLLFGIRVVSTNGKKITILQAFIRNLFKLVDVAIIIELIVASLNVKRQRLGDITAETVVIGGSKDGKRQGSDSRGDMV